MSQYKKLPPGWDSKLEPKSGKSYFVNYFTKNVSLDDPRIKQEQGSTTQETIVRNGHHRHVPLMGASAVHSNSNSNCTIQAAAMIETVAKIRSMFPTVPETHIKALLIKYHGREAVVLSALQVEKHPIRTPGPFTPPPPARPLPVPMVCRPQPKPHSPKMKLRYLKSVFPVVEETILLDTLVNADNNVTHATEKLLNLGFNKRDMPAPRVCLKKKELLDMEKAEAVKSPEPQRPKSADEKEKIKERVCAKHSEVPEKVVSIALDSSAYNEETAETILKLMVEEQQKKCKDTSGEVIESEKVIKESPEAKIEAIPSPSSNDSIKRRQKHNKNERSPILEEEEAKQITTFVSPLLSKPSGPNKNFFRGADEGLLLDDYVPWIGPEKGLAQGPDKSLVKGSRGAIGSDISLRKGPCPSLAKGSIYAKFIYTSDSRGK